MAVLTVQTISLTALEPTYASAGASGDKFDNNGKTFLHVKNGGGSSMTVTIESIEPCSFGFNHDVAITVPASGERMVGPFPQPRFNDTSGQASITYSTATSVTVAAISY